MARITPKTNWIDNDIPTAVDLNRIENNILQSFNELDIESAARIAADNSEAIARASADTTLQNNINSEASTRSNADTTLQNNITSEAITRANADSSLQSQITSEISNRQYFDQRGSATSTFTLPSGGSFMYIIITYSPPPNTITGFSSSVAGGTSVSVAANSVCFYWRIS